MIGKKIAIIDDIVISGTSIASAVNKLLHIGVPEDDIDIIALARDKDYQTMRFESNTGRNTLCCDNILDDADCIKLSYLISKAFSFYGTPYDIDYPIYPAIDLHENKIQVFFNHLLWRTESTTNIDQQAGDVTPYILFPKQNVLSILWKKLDADLSDCVHIKIRAYVRRYPSGRLECSIVPMCLFNEIAESDLENLYAKYEPRLHRINPNKGGLLIAQMRYLEFYIAHQMYLVFNDVTSFGLPLAFVRELMREMDLQSIRIGSKKRHYDETRKCQNIVKRNFYAERPNQIWVSDVTYYRFKEKQYFICVILDLYARRVIGYKVGYSNNTHLVKETFKMAYESRKPAPGLIFHTDQGANYKSRAFADYLGVREVTQSFSKPGVPYDNSVMETFFASMKQEELYRYKYRSEREFRAAVDRYIDFYNTQRSHKTLHYKTPRAKEEAYAKVHKTEAGDGAE